MRYQMNLTKNSPKTHTAGAMRRARGALLAVLCLCALFCGGCTSTKNRGETAAQDGCTAREQSCGERPVQHILADAGLSMMLPADLATVSRTELRNRTILDAAGLDSQEIRRFMRESRIWLYALDGSHRQEIMLAAYPQEGRDYDTLSDEELINLAFSTEMANALRRGGSSGRVYGAYRSGAAAWIILDIEQAAGQQTLYASEYYTVKNKKAYSVILQNMGAPLSAEQYALLKSAVDSIAFDP